MKDHQQLLQQHIISSFYIYGTILIVKFSTDEFVSSLVHASKYEDTINQSVKDTLYSIRVYEYISILNKNNKIC